MIDHKAGLEQDEVEIWERNMSESIRYTAQEHSSGELTR